jgi:geranylgeranyl diphosphate synthase type I
MVMVEGTTPARSAGEALRWSRTVVEPALREAVATLPSSMQRVVGYHFGWWDEHGVPRTADSGKALRPTLVLLTAQAVGGTTADATPAAVAIELVHNFSLLHDDVMDADVTRRHRPTAWTMFGSGAAILAGDALLTLASDVLAGSGHPAARDSARSLNSAVLHLVDGQSADMSFEKRSNVLLHECQTMAEGKTGALLGCACALGAAFGSGSPEQIAHLRAYGEKLGLAFQHVDDLLGIWGEPAVTGKPVHSDLLTRKKTLPVVLALTSRTPAGTELSALYGRDEPLSEADVVRAAELVELAGGREWSQNQADALLAEALQHLSAATPPTTFRAELAAVARLAARRDR